MNTLDLIMLFLSLVVFSFVVFMIILICKKKLSIEFCICAAVVDNTGYIWRGHRHADCIYLAELNNEGFIMLESHIGFVTSRNRFVNRQEGYKLQVAAGIPSASGGYRGERLWSEDLY